MLSRGSNEVTGSSHAMEPLPGKQMDAFAQVIGTSMATKRSTRRPQEEAIEVTRMSRWKLKHCQRPQCHSWCKMSSLDATATELPTEEADEWRDSEFLSEDGGEQRMRSGAEDARTKAALPLVEEKERGGSNCGGREGDDEEEEKEENNINMSLHSHFKDSEVAVKKFAQKKTSKNKKDHKESEIFTTHYANLKNELPNQKVLKLCYRTVNREPCCIVMLPSHLLTIAERKCNITHP